MVSRSNREGRGGQFSGVLGNVYKPTPNAAQDPRKAGKRRPVKALTEGVDGPAAETRTPQLSKRAKKMQAGIQDPFGNKKKGSIFQQAGEAVETRRAQLAADKEAERAAKYPTTSPTVGATAYRPGYTDADAARAAGKKKKKGSIWDRVREQVEARKAAQAQAEPQAFDPMLGVKESLGDAYVDPNARRPGPNQRRPGAPGGRRRPRMSAGLQGPVTERTMQREDAVAEATPLDEAGTPQRQGGTNTTNQPRSPRSRSRRNIR